jgi:ABC-2 type transport system permease protein
MRAAGAAEWLKLRRSPVTKTVSLLIVLAIPAMSYGLFWVAVNGGFGPLAAKSSGLIEGEGWDGYMSAASQIAAVAIFIAIGVTAAWVFGREFVDRTFRSLFGLAVTRRTIAYSKFAVVAFWSVIVVTAMVAVVAMLGVLGGVERSSEEVIRGLLRLLAIGLLASGLGLTSAAVASLSRGYLGAIGGLIVVVALGQMAVLFGTGGWFPYAVPGLLAVGGAEGIPAVGFAHIGIVPILVGGVVWWTGRVWDKLETE